MFQQAVYFYLVWRGRQLDVAGRAAVAMYVNIYLKDRIAVKYFQVGSEVMDVPRL